MFHVAAFVHAAHHVAVNSRHLAREQRTGVESRVHLCGAGDWECSAYIQLHRSKMVEIGQRTEETVITHQPDIHTIGRHIGAVHRVDLGVYKSIQEV